MEIKEIICADRGLEKVLEDASKIKSDLDSIIFLLDETLGSEEDFEKDEEPDDFVLDKSVLFYVNKISEINKIKIEKFKRDLSILYDFEEFDELLDMDTSILKDLYNENNTSDSLRFNIEEYIFEVEELRNIIETIILILKLNVKISKNPSGTLVM